MELSFPVTPMHRVTMYLEIIYVLAVKDTLEMGILVLVS